MTTDDYQSDHDVDWHPMHRSDVVTAPDFPRSTDFPLRRPSHHSMYCGCVRCKPQSALPTQDRRASPETAIVQPTAPVGGNSVTVHLLTVAPWEVEPGDRLLGLRTPVARILYDGRWLFIGDDGLIIAARRGGLNVQVLRGTVNDDDECPPWGIPRPGERMQVVR